MASIDHWFGTSLFPRPIAIWRAKVWTDVSIKVFPSIWIPLPRGVCKSLATISVKKTRTDHFGLRVKLFKHRMFAWWRTILFGWWRIFLRKCQWQNKHKEEFHRQRGLSSTRQTSYA